jgi:hypothetical protein
MNELIEKYAIKMALGNNGGEWATHYTDKQKEVWRERARELLRDIVENIDEITWESEWIMSDEQT